MRRGIPRDNEVNDMGRGLVRRKERRQVKVGGRSSRRKMSKGLDGMVNGDPNEHLVQT